MSVRKWLIDLDEIDHRLAVAGRERGVADEDLGMASAAADDAGFRMIVSETAQASLEFRKATGDVERLRIRRAEVDRLIVELNQEREQLLRRISPPVNSRG